MPVVRTTLARLASLTGISDATRLRDVLFNLKCETEVEDDGTVAIEVQSDRIDMFSVEGIAYAVRLYEGLEEPRVRHARTLFKVYVDPPLKRPFIAVAAVTGVKLDEDSLKELIEFQERLHTSYGRNRRKVAIGLHDLAKLPKGDIVYREVDIRSATMIPLFGSNRITVEEVLNTTDQGKHYGEISLNGDRHPALIAGDEIIALPPVINSDITKLETSSRDVFVDVTGTDLNAVISVLNAIVHALSFYGGEVLGAEVHYPDRLLVTPDLSFKQYVVDLDFASTWLGIEVGELVRVSPKALQRMGYIVDSIDSTKIVVRVPMYRCDILHQVDILEDIVMGIGYDRVGIENVEPLSVTRKCGGITARGISEMVRDVLVGLGYVEINTLTLVPSEIASISSDTPYPEIINALSKELNALRSSLIPSVLAILRDSQYIPMPVKIFEVGEVVEKCSECYNGWRNRTRAAFAVMDSEIRFEDVHADLFALFSELGIEKLVTVESCIRRPFIGGRCGCIKYNDRELGVIGEVHPEVLEVIGIEYPIAMVELDIETLAGVLLASTLQAYR
uniref:phenylalanine--tRNA ligase n=1 Tax=Ignisphaera aggregans TaxID=334771 RepID=A0A7C2ZUZ2_9CREN